LDQKASRCRRVQIPVNRSPRWPCMCLSAATGNGGCQQARIRLSGLAGQFRRRDLLALGEIHHALKRISWRRLAEHWKLCQGARGTAANGRGAVMIGPARSDSPSRLTRTLCYRGTPHCCEGLSLGACAAGHLPPHLKAQRQTPNESAANKDVSDCRRVGERCDLASRTQRPPRKILLCRRNSTWTR
jgi:hypothetical protein